MVILERDPSRKLLVPVSWECQGSKQYNQCLMK